MKDTYEQGIEGETIAEQFLANMGMTTLERRWKCYFGEIDLIMKERSGTIVFVEVKKRRKGKPGDGLSAIDKKKQRRISKAALLYLIKSDMTEKCVRFDAVEIISGQINHIQNAFEPGGMHFGGGFQI